MNKEHIPSASDDDDDIDIDAIFDRIDPDKVKDTGEEEELLFDFSDIWEEFEKDQQNSDTENK